MRNNKFARSFFVLFAVFSLVLSFGLTAPVSAQDDESQDQTVGDINTGGNSGGVFIVGDGHGPVNIDGGYIENNADINLDNTQDNSVNVDYTVNNYGWGYDGYYGLYYGPDNCWRYDYWGNPVLFVC